MASRCEREVGKCERHCGMKNQPGELSYIIVVVKMFSINTSLCLHPRQLQPRKIQLKRLLLKDLRYLWILIFKHPIFPYEAKQDLIERLELNSSEKVTLCCGYTAETCKLSDI